MISNYKKAKWTNTILSILLIIIVGLVGMTGCQKSTQDTDKDKTEVTEEADKTDDTKAAEADMTTSTKTADEDKADSTSEAEEGKTDSTNTAVVTLAPTVTPIPALTETSNSEQAVNLTYLNEILGLGLDELVTKLGKDYTKVDEGGLEFTKPGIRVWFGEKNTVNQIWTNNAEIDFNDAKIGDSIDSFQTAFGEPAGEGEASKLFKVEENYLEVYYDNDKAFAIYLLTEEAALARFEKLISSVQPAPTDATPNIKTE